MGFHCLPPDLFAVGGVLNAPELMRATSAGGWGPQAVGAGDIGRRRAERVDGEVRGIDDDNGLFDECRRWRKNARGSQVNLDLARDDRGT